MNVTATKVHRRLPVLMAWVLCAAIGCRETDLVGNNCTESTGLPCRDVSLAGAGGDPGTSIDTLDLLFVVENTPGMANHQLALAQAMPEMIRVLVTGDVLNDSDPEFRGVNNLNFAVVSTDMGTPGVTGLNDCGDDTGRPLGDDGRFLSNPSATTVLGRACTDLPTFLSYSVFDPTRSFDTARQVTGCLTQIGLSGCRHAMPLEAALKALWFRTDGVTFLNGMGHGVGDQGGFLRTDGLLAIIVVTTQDDCSALDLSQFRLADQLPMGDLRAVLGRDLRCGLLSDGALYPRTRYKSGFGDLKSGNLSRVFLGVIAGVPTDLANQLAMPLSSSQRRALYDELLEDPRMVRDVDDPSAAEPHLRASCGAAVPPVRLVQLAQSLEGQAAVASICNGMSTSLATMTQAIARLIDPTTTL